VIRKESASKYFDGFAKILEKAKQRESPAVDEAKIEEEDKNEEVEQDSPVALPIAEEDTLLNSCL